MNNGEAQKEIRVLFAEDSEDDFLLMLNEFRQAGYRVDAERIDQPGAMAAALDRRRWDIVLSDWTMPQFAAMDAFRLLRQSAHPPVPFVVVSGSIGEERAVAALKQGINNYVLKTNLPHLVPVVERELEDARIRIERNAAVEALRQAVKARDEFLSIASHELKTPLTALQLQAQSLLRAAKREISAPLTDDMVVQRIQSVVRNANRLTTLVDRLLDITRVTNARVELVYEELDLSSLVREVLERMEDVFRGAKCTAALEAPAPVLGHWDRLRLEAVITNLFDNAVKYGAGKPIRVTVEDLGRVARLCVVDHGIGVSEEDQARIFGRFERAVPDRNYGGFGLGLWLARQLTEAHGGEISVTSRPAEGSTFTVTLPKQGASDA